VNGEVKDGKPISARFGNMAQCSWKALRMDRNTSSIGWTEPVGQAVVKGVFWVWGFGDAGKDLALLDGRCWLLMRFDEDRDSGRISARRLNQAVESVQHILGKPKVLRGWKGDLRCTHGWVVTID